MGIMRKVAILIVFLVLSGCASRQAVMKGSKITLPKPPKVVVMDTGKYDKEKYPDTDWVKPPKQDLKQRRASWSFEDIEKISRALTEWPRWAKDTEEIVEGHNKSVGHGTDSSARKWWKFWEK